MRNTTELQKIDQCRMANSKELIDFLKFPPLPIAGTYINSDEEIIEQLLPMTVCYCPDSGLVQLREKFPPEIYIDYHFVGTVSDSYVSHLNQCALELANEYGIRGKRVLEIGCSNGYLLGKLRDMGNEVFGYEPSLKLHKLCEASGIPSVSSFFSKTGLSICPFDKADALIARHVLEHIDDLTDFVHAIDQILAADGIVLIEVPDLNSILDRKLYAHFYHEHVNYFSIHSLVALFATIGLVPVSHRVVEIHSGSIYVIFKRKCKSIVAISTESAREITEQSCRMFAEELQAYYKRLNDFMTTQKKKGLRLAGYGAAHRSTVMCGLGELGQEHFDYLVDKNPHLSGLKMPQTHLPIYSPEMLLTDMPDAVAIFATSFENEVITEQAEYIRRGGRFISLLPEVRDVN